MENIKSAIRQYTLHQRRSILLVERQKANAAIFRQVINLPIIKKANTVSCYVSTAEEVNTHQIIHWLLQEGKRVAIPKVINPMAVALHTITSFRDIAPGRFNIFEPQTQQPAVDPNDVDMWIVPGVAFDRTGGRIGWGKGYYDRLLTNIHVPLLGLAYSCQIVPHIPLESYDILMTTIVTEKEIIYHSTDGEC